MNGMNVVFGWKKLQGAVRRRRARWFGRRLFEIPPSSAKISFTFDDFPRTAFTNGGAILKEFGGAGTYYVSHGLMEQTGPTGQLFHGGDLPDLLSRGHELGCHTFHHHPAWETAPSEYISSIDDNASTLASVLKTQKLQTHSYPISYPRPETKRRLASRFRACRGGGQTFNHGSIDLNYLNSFFIEQSCDDFGAIEKMIEANAEAGGWLVFSTHDVCANPTRFGCTPAFFEKIVRSSAQSGAKILVMSAALDAIGVRPLP